MYSVSGPIKNCRVCRSSELNRIWHLGRPFVSGFVAPGKAYAGPLVPIEIKGCKNCGLVQNIYTAPQELLYSKFYWYRSGVTDTMKTALKDVYLNSVIECKFSPGREIVLDIGSNDGTFLRNFSNGWIKIGFEPAKNLVEEGSKGGIRLINDFWNLDAFQYAAAQYGRVGQKAKIITALGMFYDLEDPNQFIADIAAALEPDGLFIAQLMCLEDMLQVCDLGNFAHEHLEFYTMSSLDYLMNSNGLEIYKVETNTVNGQSTRLYIQHRGGPKSTDPSVPKRRLAEIDIHIRFEDFISNCNIIKNKLKRLFYSLHRSAKKIAIYGASTKGNTIIQYLDFDEPIFEFAAERSPEKFGLVTAGSNIPIISEEEARQRRPDYFFVLPYAFIDEFVIREQEWLRGGGKFIVPFPNPRIISMTVDNTIHTEYL